MSVACGSRGTTVVIADGDATFRRRLRTALTAGDVTVLAETGTVADGARLAVHHRPGVLIMDPRLDPVGSIATLRTMLRCVPGTAVLVLSERDDDEAVIAALRAGTRGYLRKDAGPCDLLRAVHAVAAGEAIFDASLAARVTDLLSRRTRPWPYPLAGLSRRERTVLELMATELPTAAIAHRLRLAPKTVRNHTSAILGKLGVTDRAGAIAHARAAGLVPAS